MQTELARNASYIDGMASLFDQYHLVGWQQPFARLKSELTDYDAWLRANVLPKARTDLRLPPEEYALALEGYGIDIPPARIAELAHSAFRQIQSQMAPIAAQIATTRGLPSNDYRAVITELKKAQITGEAILPFYEKRLHEIEQIIRERHLVTLPDRPCIIRIATPAETAQEPAPHMVPPPLLHNTGQRGVFVLPLNGPAVGGQSDRYDDFSYDAVSWTLTSHEARPGHELQFDSMVEHGVSLARALFAFNSTNVEGWGLYAEYIMQPYEPPEGQLLTLAAAAAAGGTRVPGPGAAERRDHTGTGLRCAREGCDVESRLRARGGRALHVPLARTGEQLLLRLHEAVVPAARRRDGARRQVRCEALPRFHPG